MGLCAPVGTDGSTYASIYHVVWRKQCWVFILTGQYRWGVSAVAWCSIPLTYRNSMYFLASINIQNKSEHPGGNRRQYLSFFMH